MTTFTMLPNERQELIDFLDASSISRHTPQEKTEDFFDRILPPVSLETNTFAADGGVRVLPDGVYTVCFYPPDLPMADRNPASCTDYVTLRLRTQADDASFKPGDQIVGYLVGPDNSSDYVNFAHVATKPAPATPQASLNNPQFVVWHRFKHCELKGHSSHVLLNVLMASPIKHAQAFGVRSRRCSICGRQLTVPSSIAAGIGPTCAKQFKYQ